VERFVLSILMHGSASVRHLLGAAHWMTSHGWRRPINNISPYNFLSFLITYAIAYRYIQILCMISLTIYGKIIWFSRVWKTLLFWFLWWPVTVAPCICINAKPGRGNQITTGVQEIGRYATIFQNRFYYLAYNLRKIRYCTLFHKYIRLCQE